MKEFIVVYADTCLPSSDNYSTDIGCMHVKLFICMQYTYTAYNLGRLTSTEIAHIRLQQAAPDRHADSFSYFETNVAEI